MNFKSIMMFFMFACSAHAVQFDVAQPIWTTAEKGEINSSVIFASALAILLQADFDTYFAAKE